MMTTNRDRILFVGDSITDANRNYEAKPGTWSSWGEGYVNLINSITTAFFPEKELMIINKGVSGDRVTDLFERWDTDVTALNPDIVTIMIGINDVWRHFDSVFSQESQISEEMFAETIAKIIRKVDRDKTKIIFLSAFMMEASLDDPMRKMLTKYNQITEKTASEYKCQFINVQDAIDRFLQVQSSYVLSMDRVHPSLAGHQLIAKSWLEGMGLAY
ncbi:hypothetical protein RU97_GL000543 [Enterococcus canis]|uniref:SGNH hydrolase-type esterase domain-containing protein n=1 Tax=Enterococcus canis TaxID=214095 RepID=A0A1L8RKK3_9ENTE|nr:SGNH/GDSL hydrolase family protein [Enterococcus canis]OJG20310.1 hypothetical protein RU97_GL000543 [Enterococcus canis]